MEEILVAAGIVALNVFIVWMRARNDRLSPMDDLTGEPISADGFDRANVSGDEIGELEGDDYFTDSQVYYGEDSKGNYIFLKLSRQKNCTAETSLVLGLSDGRTFELLTHPNTVVCDNSVYGWSAAGLNINPYELERRCRITYNGLLKRTDSGIEQDKTNNVEHVRLNFIFISSSPPQNLTEFRCSKQSTWKNWLPSFNSIQKVGLEEINQWGSLIGQVRFEDSKNIDLYLHSLRQRQWGKFDWSNFQKHVSITGFTTLGTSFFISSDKLSDGLNNILSGHLRHPNDRVEELTGVNFDTKNLSSKIISNQFRIQFQAQDKSYDITFNTKNATEKVLYGGNPWNSEYRYYNVEFQINEYKGWGILQIWVPYDGPNLLKLTQPAQKFVGIQEKLVDSDIYTVSFHDPKCQIESLTGGKGSSIGILSAIETDAFTVPKGFCVTVFALKSQIKSSDQLSRAICNLKEVCGGLQKGDLKETCQSVVELIQDAEIVDLVKYSIDNEIKQLIQACNNDKGSDKTKWAFAIRSSAIGEDNEETSAAGQNSTFLGVEEDQIFKYITHCWASLYTYQSVEYRRQNGLPIDASMGVCVQIMVDAEAAGVLFTRNPVSGDPRNIIITSNYGLGEAVVSALVDPDTIIVTRNQNDDLTVQQSTIGTKKQKITLTTGHGTQTTALSEADSSKMSINNETALRLAKVGMFLENFFGSSRDIEWAVVEGDIFLLQSRPITALDDWTDFELAHELSSGVPHDLDIITFANIGEVLPHPMSTLSMSVVMKLLNACSGHQISKVSDVNRNTHHRNIFVISMRCALNYYNVLLQFPTKKLTLGNRISDIAVSGHLIATPDVFKTAQERNGIIGAKMMFELLCQMISEMWDIDNKVKQIKEFSKKKSLKDLGEFKTSRDLYNAICGYHNIFLKFSIAHNHASKVSVYYQILTMSILMEGADDLLAEHFSDFSLLLSTTANVISAQVPKGMMKIAEAIRKHGLAEEFFKVEKTEAKEWLRVRCPEAFEMLTTFLKEHGCRGVMEFDLIAETWDMRPDELLATIQVIVTSDKQETISEDLSPEETVERLKSPISSRTKWMLKKLIPYCRRAVERREMTKFLSISCVHEMRMAYKKLANLLMKETRLPDENLIFALTHPEIGSLIDKPWPTLIRKAVRRRKVYQQMKKCRFDEMYIGMPLFTEESSEVIRPEGGAFVRGTAVCNGIVTGRAFVALNKEEAAKLESGDILITRATDIGWSPYFPLLGGIATELGGIISHGAVVAREYGLPCVVSAVDATKIFKTGDQVRLNGTIGTIEVIEEIKEK